MPALSMERAENVAMPADTVTADPPLSVPPLGLVAMARLTVVVLFPVSTFPLASSTATVTAGDTSEPACVVLGPATKASLLAVPGVMVKLDDVATAKLGTLDAESV